MVNWLEKGPFSTYDYQRNGKLLSKTLKIFVLFLLLFVCLEQELRVAAIEIAARIEEARLALVFRTSRSWPVGLPGPHKTYLFRVPYYSFFI